MRGRRRRAAGGDVAVADRDHQFRDRPRRTHPGGRGDGPPPVHERLGEQRPVALDDEADQRLAAGQPLVSGQAQHRAGGHAQRIRRHADRIVQLCDDPPESDREDQHLDAGIAAPKVRFPAEVSATGRVHMDTLATARTNVVSTVIGALGGLVGTIDPRCGRSDTSAEKTSATVITRAATGWSPALTPRWYPVASQRSWCRPASRATGASAEQGSDVHALHGLIVQA